MKRGQEFAVFKLVIAAAFAMVMLGVILGVTAYLQSQAFGSSAFGTTFSILRDAANAPEKCFFRERVVFFAGDAFSGESIKRAGLEKVSVQFISSVSAVQCTGSGCSATEQVAIPVVAKCDSGANCRIWYGEDKCL